MAIKMGRPSIFTPKDGDQTIRAIALTTVGQRLFNAARGRLRTLAKWTGHVSDADTIEYLVRGEQATKDFLAKKNNAAKG